MNKPNMILLIGMIFAVRSYPVNILLSMNSAGNIYVRWISNIPADTEPSYLIYSRLDALGDISYLPKLGKQLKAKLSSVIYSVELLELQSNKLYVYQVGNDNTGWSAVFSFMGPVQKEEHYPNLAVLGEISNSTASFTVLSQLISRSFIERLDGILVFCDLHDHPLYDAIQSNIPIMYVPLEHSDEYYSVKYYNTYLIFLNTVALDDRQLKWVKSELSEAQRYYWIIVVGQAPLGQINLHFNFTEIFMEFHSVMYLNYGEFYATNTIKYPLAGHLHLHFQETSELILIQQGPSWTDSIALSANNTIYATRRPGYGIITPKYASFIWQEFRSIDHRLAHQITQHRIDSSPRKKEEVRNFKIIFVITFIIFIAAFGQNFVQKEMERRRINAHRPLESGKFEY